MNLDIVTKSIRHGHLFCGIGGGAKGFNRGHARVGNIVAKFECVGGIDVDEAVCRDFGRQVGVDATPLDLFSLEQYEAFHGRSPPPGWTQAGPEDLRRAFTARPNIVFLSAPCKGFSGLLPEERSGTDKYQALNELTLRGIDLLLDAYEDDPVELIIFENVPRIMTRGRWLLDRIQERLGCGRYISAETTHDCGELGNLAQSRKRFLMVARHRDKIPNFLYEPVKHRLRGVGEVLDQLPMPLSGQGGAMHRVPELQWKTWLRLAFVVAGGDWRSLNRLAVEDGFLRDYGVVPVPAMRGGTLGVHRWQDSAGAVTTRGGPTNGAFAVADPRDPTSNADFHRSRMRVNEWDQVAGAITGQRSPGSSAQNVADPRPLPVADLRREEGRAEFGQYGVKGWDQTSQAVIGKAAVGAGHFAVADPRMDGKRFNSAYRVVRWSAAGPAVAGPGGPGNGLAVADPRAPQGAHVSKYRVTRPEEPAGAVIAASGTGNGAFAVADPDLGGLRNGALGVRGWSDPAGTVAGETYPTNGAYAVADPRPTHGPNAHTSKHNVQEWTAPARTVTGTDRVGSGALCVADPRCSGYGANAQTTRFQVNGWDDTARTVTGGKHVQSGAPSVADPRVRKEAYGVVAYDQPAKAVSGAGQHDNGYGSVADERVSLFAPSNEDQKSVGLILPGPTDRLVCVIVAEDGTWHRPFTTLELAALQGLVDPEEHFELEGLSDAAWRERIGNCVPPPSATAIANVMGETLLRAWAGESFRLSEVPIWVRNVAVALSFEPQENLDGCV